jgi:uncharacterized RDD family membrane protein YckC
LVEEILKKLQYERLTLATINRRSIAFFIDEMIISILFYIIYADSFAKAASLESVIELTNMLFFQVILLKIIYHTFFVWMYGATIGKIFLKIKVVSIDELDNPNLMSSFIRAVVRIVSEFLLYLGFLWAFFDKARQAWHDKAAKTVVVNV